MSKQHTVARRGHAEPRHSIYASLRAESDIRPALRGALLVLLLPTGTYNDALRNDTTSPCTQCPTGRTTLREGGDSISDCQACKEGYGGPDCATPCGGVGAAASYGPAGRAVGSECVACSVAKAGYSFSWMGSNDLFAPRSVAKLGAAASRDCLAEFVQVRRFEHVSMCAGGKARSWCVSAAG